MNIDEEIKFPFRNDYHRGIVNLNYTVNKLTYDFFQLLRKHKLTEAQYNILWVLHSFHSGGPVSIGFLKERMLDRSSDVSRVVEKLFEKGLVSRKENVHDRRQKDVEITSEGAGLISSMDDCVRKMYTLLQNLSNEEVKSLNLLLDKIRSCVNCGKNQNT